jgi:hypothetical protein
MLLYVFYIFLAERHTDRPLFARRKFANSHDRKPARERERERERIMFQFWENPKAITNV